MPLAALVKTATAKVENVIELPDGSNFAAPPGYMLIHREDGHIGDSWNGSTFTSNDPPAPPVPVTVPASITRRQLIMALLDGGFITEAEAIAAAQTGAVPAFVMAYFNQLPDHEKTDATITWATMSMCLRADPLLLAVAAAGNLTSEQLDDYFRVAAAL